MSEARRAYRSQRREEQARATRGRVVQAATTLFVSKGYAATNVAEIAEAAGVSARMVYLAFPSKRALLDAALGVALAGDDAPSALREREWFAETLAARGDEIPRLFAEHTAALQARAANLLQAAEAAAAADPELAERRDHGRMARRADLHRVAEALATKTGVDPDHATDVLYTLGSSAVFDLLVNQCGWALDRYQGWLAAVIRAGLEV